MTTDTKPCTPLRTIVRGAYDIQKLRIQMGNRIVGNFKAKLGQKPSESEETLDPEAQDILKELRARYKKITDGVAFPKNAAAFEGVGDEVISTYTELCLIAQYIQLEASEKDHFRRLGAILGEYPIYTGFLADIKGIGPAIAGVLLSEIDIGKARYPSSLWAYAGLDVVGGWVLEDAVCVGGDSDAANAFIALRYDPRDLREGDPIPDGIPLTRPLRVLDDQERAFEDDWLKLSITIARPSFRVLVTYRYESKGGRSRRQEHLVQRDYIDKDGKPAKRWGITFNPFLKTKLLGVLGPSFLRVGADGPYAQMYRDEKNRLENHAQYGTVNDKKKDDDGKIITSKGRRHAMAMRKMVKFFLIDLYKAWRAAEGLIVHPPYAEAKLGIVHGQDV